jgi:hypothetical protein
VVKIPKLDKKAAGAVDKVEAASGSFLLPEGRYAAQLLKVEEKEGAEHPYWTWAYGNLHNSLGELVPGRQWNNTSLSPKSYPFLKATFEAFGYTTDSDTDEMVGEWVVLYLVQEPIGKGPKAGQLRNSVQSLAEFDKSQWDFNPGDFSPADAAKASGDEY